MDEDDTRKCPDCGRWFAKDDMVKISGEDECPSVFACVECATKREVAGEYLADLDERRQAEEEAEEVFC